MGLDILPKNTPRWVRAFALVAGLTLVLCGAWLCLCTTADPDERDALRDPKSGICVGAEDRDLGPVDASGVVLFVHGFVGGGSNFADVPEAVAAKGWRVRVLRLPGHGTSPRDLALQTADGLIAAVRDETRRLRAQHTKVVLVGHSMGAALCALTAAEVPVDGLVLAGAYFGLTPKWYYGLKPETWIRVAQPFLPWMYKGALFLQVDRREAAHEIFSYTWIPTQSAAMLLDIGQRVRQPELLSKVTCPVLLLHGQRDGAASPQAARDAVAAMGSSQKKCVWLEHSNHHLFFDFDRDQVKQEILAFLADTPPPEK